MADHPDFYTDGFTVSVSPFGITVTFQRTEPSLEAGTHVDSGEIVARARMSPALAKVLAQGLADSVAQQANIQQTEPRVRH